MGGRGDTRSPLKPGRGVGTIAERATDCRLAILGFESSIETLKTSGFLPRPPFDSASPDGSDAQGAESDRVGGDAGVADAVDRPLHGERPLPLGVEVAVDAGGHAGALELGDARPGAAVLVERGI